MTWIVLAVAAVCYIVLFRRSIFIVAYHGIERDWTPIPGLLIDPDSFRKQLRVLAAVGLRSERIDEVVQDLRSGRRMRRPRLCLTFDDAYRNLRSGALDLVRERGWRATVFVPTAHAGGWNVWDQANGVPRLEILSWEELRELAAQGVAIGAHGNVHVSLPSLSEQRATAEVRQALGELAARLPAYSRVFCYPFGHRAPQHRRVLEEAGYIGACSMVAGAFPDSTEVFDLGRMLVRGDSVARFALDLALYPIKSFLRSRLPRLRS